MECSSFIPLTQFGFIVESTTDCMLQFENTGQSKNLNMKPISLEVILYWEEFEESGDPDVSSLVWGQF